MCHSVEGEEEKNLKEQIESCVVRPPLGLSFSEKRWINQMVYRLPEI